MAEGLRVRYRYIDLASADEPPSLAKGRFLLRGAAGALLRPDGDAAAHEIALDEIDEVTVEQDSGLHWLLALLLIEDRDEAPSASVAAGPAPAARARRLEVQVAAQGSGHAEPLALKAAIEALLAQYTEVDDDDADDADDDDDDDDHGSDSGDSGGTDGAGTRGRGDGDADKGGDRGAESAGSEPSASAASAQGVDGLQFDTVEYAEDSSQSAPPAGACRICNQAFGEAYFDVNGAACCERCLSILRAYRDQGSAGLRFLKALLFGSFAAAAGAGLYYAIVALTGYEIGLVAIVVGLMVGAAVRAGSQRRGGPGYQALAMALTYLAIVVTYMQMINRELDRHFVQQRKKSIATLIAKLAKPEHAASEQGARDTLQLGLLKAQTGAPERTLVRNMVVFGLAFIWPFYSIYVAGFSGLIGLLIVAFALYEAWKLCRRQPFEVSGPFAIAGASAASPPAS
jgi:hypothetical protein